RHVAEFENTRRVCIAILRTTSIQSPILELADSVAICLNLRAHHHVRAESPNASKLSDRGWRKQAQSTRKSLPPASVRWSAWLGHGPPQQMLVVGEAQHGKLLNGLRVLASGGRTILVEHARRKLRPEPGELRRDGTEDGQTRLGEEKLAGLKVD